MLTKTSFIITFLVIITLGTPAFSDPSAPKEWKQANSACVVKSSGGEYSSVSVFKSKEKVFTPDCDCYVTPTFSPSGRYIAFTNSEMDLFKIGDSPREFRLVIYNCETGKVKGYLKGKSVSGPSEGASMNWVEVKEWAKDERSIDVLDASAHYKSKAVHLTFGGNTKLP